MDPKGDPMYMLLCIDYYALASRQFQFVIDLFESNIDIVHRSMSEQSTNAQHHLSSSRPELMPVSNLPGLQFSVALARSLSFNLRRKIS
jgi:hypothetical protein